MAEVKIPKQLQRSRTKDEAEAARSAQVLLGLLARWSGHDDLAGLDVLDVGCGVKFTQALIEDGVPIGSYTGLDVHQPLVDHLRAEVDDPRFSYARVDFLNARYNPTGVPMDAESTLPVDDRRFDVICGFSLFTHLDPADFASMLAMMRRHVRDDGRLVFTVFVDRHTPGGHGVVDRYSEALGGSVSTGEAYRDFWPDDVLRVALYSEEHVRALVADAGWELVELLDPIPEAQHVVVARPRT